jgi:hypothetical protein
MGFIAKRMPTNFNLCCMIPDLMNLVNFTERYSISSLVVLYGVFQYLLFSVEKSYVWIRVILCVMRFVEIKNNYQNAIALKF